MTESNMKVCLWSFVFSSVGHVIFLSFYNYWRTHLPAVRPSALNPKLKLFQLFLFFSKAYVSFSLLPCSYLQSTPVTMTYYFNTLSVIFFYAVSSACVLSHTCDLLCTCFIACSLFLFLLRLFLISCR